jgi:hypothetical protein
MASIKKFEKPAEKMNISNGELIQIEGALGRLVALDEKMAVESSYRIIKTLRYVAEEAKILRESLKPYIEYEQKAMGAAQSKDSALMGKLFEEYAPVIQDARAFLESPYDGTEFPKLKLNIFKKADGTGMDIPTGLLNALMPILEE